MSRTKEKEVTMDGAVRPGPGSEHIIWRYFIGDLPALTDWLEGKHLLLKLPIWVLRGLGAPLFLNNPISGVLILIGMFIHSSWMTVCGLVGQLVAIVTALLLGQPHALIANGVLTFHALLVGMVIAITVDKPDWYGWSIMPIVVMAIISVYFASAFGALYGKLGIPCCNLPFNLSTWLFIAAAKYATPNHHFPIKVTPPTPLNETFAEVDLDWNKVFHPLLLAGAQVYLSDKLVVGALIMVACVIGSPCIAYHNLIGSLLSIGVALALAVPPAELYSGVWGFNAVLVACSLGGLWWVITPQTHVLALVGATLATIIFGALSVAFRPCGLPALAFGYAFTTPVFLGMTSESRSYIRVPLDQVTTPERHWRLFRHRKGVHAGQDSHSKSDQITKV